MSLFDDAPPAEPASAVARRLPHDHGAEQAVLGAMLDGTSRGKDAINEVMEIFGSLARSVFYDPAHAKLYDVITGMHAEGTPIDIRTVGAEVTKLGMTQETGGFVYLSQLTMASPSTAHAEHYANTVLRAYKWRRHIEAATRALQDGWDQLGEPEDAHERAVAEFAAIGSLSTAKEPYAPIGDVLEIAMDEIEAISNHDGAVTGVPTGYTDLDQLTNGLQPGQLVVIGARPAMGKSTLAMDLARSASVKHHKPTLFVTLEMRNGELGMRLLSAEARVGLHHMRSGTVTDEDWTRIAGRLSEVSAAPLFISDTPNMTLGQIRTVCHRLQQKHGLGLVVVDYLQLMQSPPGRRGENRQQVIADMARGLKLLAGEFEIPVIALSQLNRGSEQRQDKKPVLSDLRESGSIEQDADVVILLHREDAYEKESPRSGEADLIVAKHRNGPTATITVAAQLHYSRFVDMAQT